MSYQRFAEGELVSCPTAASLKPRSVGRSACDREDQMGSADVRLRRWKRMKVERLVLVFRAGVCRDEIFDEIHRRYGHSVRKFFARKGFPTEDCLDLTQEAFLRLWRGLPDFRGESKFRSWLHTVIGNVGRSAVDKQIAMKNKGENIPFDDLADRVSDSGSLHSASTGATGALKQLLTQEKERALRREMNELPPRMLRIILLRIDQGLKLREIADHEKISINTVKSQLGQAKVRLRPGLARYLGKPNDTEPEETS